MLRGVALLALTAYSAASNAAVLQPEPYGQAAAQQNNSGQHAKLVQDLINRAEASYQSGVSNYNANRLDAARLDFDFAVDTMLSSGMDLKNEPALSDEFDSLISRINSLEIVALKQGNGFSPKVEAAPAENAEEVTFVANPALVGKVTQELKTTQSDLPLVINQYVAGWIDAYSSSSARRGHLKASLERAGKYKDMIMRILRENGVPQDLIYQAITESGFQPQALNARSGAAGMWQFMPFVEAFGLERNGYFDERFDPEKSTIAYAKYMKFLYAQTGDWYLAMAAYDWGLGNVRRVVARTGYADYWDLYRHNAMPAETMAYIPSVIAAVIMAKNPEQYGLTGLTPEPAVLSDTVTTNYAISLPLVADITGSTVQEIVALNPAMLRLSTPPDRSYDLHIPPGTTEIFQTRLKDFPEENRASWRFHIVKDGETLNQIAESLHAKPAQVAEFNDVTAVQPLQAGDELIVPITASAGTSGQTHYTTHRSDTLVTVADRFGVTVQQLRAWNHLSSNRIVPGRTLNVAEPIRMAPSGRGTRRGRRGSHSSSHFSTRGSHAATTTTTRGKTHPGSQSSTHKPAPRSTHPSTTKHSSTTKSSSAKPKKH